MPFTLLCHLTTIVTLPDDCAENDLQSYIPGHFWRDPFVCFSVFLYAELCRAEISAGDNRGTEHRFAICCPSELGLKWTSKWWPAIATAPSYRFAVCCQGKDFLKGIFQWQSVLIIYSDDLLVAIATQNPDFLQVESWGATQQHCNLSHSFVAPVMIPSIKINYLFIRSMAAFTPLLMLILA